MEVQHTDRTSYDFLNLMGDLGGVGEFLVIVFKLCAAPFAIIRIKAIVTNRLFHLSAANR